MEKVAVVCQLVQKMWNVRVKTPKSRISQLGLAFLSIPIFSLFRESSQYLQLQRERAHGPAGGRAVLSC